MTPPGENTCENESDSPRLPLRKVVRKINRLTPTPKTVEVPTHQAVDRVLSEPLQAREDLPRYDQSSMDGYAVRSKDLRNASKRDPVRLACTRESPAGEDNPEPLPAEETARIFTGGPVPEGADAVVPQEVVQTREDHVEFTKPIDSGENIRFRGEELERGVRLLDAGTVMNTAATGLAMSQGVRELQVYRAPRSAVLSIGDELIDPDETPGPAQKRDTNAPMVHSLLEDLGCQSRVERLADEPEELERRFEENLEERDLLVIIGGTSVGDRDYVRPVLEELGVETIFWKINQKPGKPLYLGERDDSYVLGLPGNPVSAMVSLYLHGFALVRKLSGYPDDALYLPSVETELDNAYKKETERIEFVRAVSRRSGDGYRSEILSHQGSHMLSGLARANSLVALSGPPSEFGPGESQVAFLLPDSPSLQDELFRYDA